MPKYLIERNIPEAGNLSAQDLQAIAVHSCQVIDEMGPQVQWVQTYVTPDALYCVYNAANEDLVREHARKGGFPADRVLQIRTTFDPVTAEG